MSLAPAPSVGIGASSTNGGGGSGAAAAAVTAAVVVAAGGVGGGGGAPGLCWTTAWYCLERKPMPPGLFDCVMEAPRLCGRGEPADAAPGDRFWRRWRNLGVDILIPFQLVACGVGSEDIFLVFFQLLSSAQRVSHQNNGIS